MQDVFVFDLPQDTKLRVNVDLEPRSGAYDPKYSKIDAKPTV